MAREKILGEGFRTLELGGAGIRAEDDQPGLVEAIDDTGHQWRLGADDGQVDCLFAGKSQQAVDILGADGDVFEPGFGGGAGITGRDVNPVGKRRLRRLPRQRVFRAAAADDQ